MSFEVRDTEVQGHVTTEAEIGVMHLLTKEHHGSTPEARKRQ